MGPRPFSPNVSTAVFLIRYIRQLPGKLKLMGGGAVIYSHPNLLFCHNF
jgi:hypothetical protein